MSAIKNKIDDFLNNGGLNLGYQDNELPKLDDMDMILKNNVPIWEYKGKTEKEYYGGEDE